MKRIQFAGIVAVMFLSVCTVLLGTTSEAGDPQATENSTPAPFSRQVRAKWDYQVLDLDEIATLGAGEDKASNTNKAPNTNKANVQFGLNALGTQGWELCHVNGDTFYFKRPRVFKPNEWPSNS